MWHFTTHPDGTIDVWDHTGTKVADGRSFKGWYFGDYPDEVLDVMRENMDGSGQPTAYNQNLIADAATGNIVEGTPP